jgi:hypothetical protein
MKTKRKLGTLSMVLLAVLLSDCGKSADKARDEARIDSLDKVREAAIALRVAIHDGTHYNELRPFIQKLAVEIAIAKDKGEDSEAFQRYDFALSEIKHNYDTGAVLGFWIVYPFGLWTPLKMQC